MIVAMLVVGPPTAATGVPRRGRVGTREIFTAATVVIGTALLMHTLGLSVSLGAFLAGVLLADSEQKRPHLRRPSIY
ncbi:MAG: hypothetical protein ACREVK_06640 [Gammaproteobacteria bacterium]